MSLTLTAGSAARERAIAGARTNPALQRIAVVGNHLPRHCGIATFTSHLAAALTDAAPSIDCRVIAVNDPGKSHDYPDLVRFEITEADAISYQRAADYLNVNGVDLVSVQHEFGIFGGKAGSHLLVLLRELRMPIVSTLHTILAEPNAQQRLVIDEIAELSQRLVVMSRHGASLLQSCYGIAPGKIDVIPHGIPRVPATKQSKRRLGVEHRLVLTFGEIEDLLGFPLPAAARTDRGWWSGTGTDRTPQSDAWTLAHRTVSVNFQARNALFERVASM